MTQYNSLVTPGAKEGRDATEWHVSTSEVPTPPEIPSGDKPNILNENQIIRDYHDVRIISWALSTGVIPRELISWDCCDCEQCIGRKYNKGL